MINSVKYKIQKFEVVTIKRQVFFSFHYGEDVWRASQVRNMGVVEGQRLFSDNSWEKVRYKDDQSIKKWIDNEMQMRSCLVVLIGSQTYSRKWVQYEIQQAWKLGKGIVGIYVHNLEDSSGQQTTKGKNPFDGFCIDKTFNYIAARSIPADDNEIPLELICEAYDPHWLTSTNVYNDIKEHIHDLIEKAIRIRNMYPK